MRFAFELLDLGFLEHNHEYKTFAFTFALIV
jgi:hypothetical protein